MISKTVNDVKGIKMKNFIEQVSINTNNDLFKYGLQTLNSTAKKKLHLKYIILINSKSTSIKKFVFPF